MNTTWGRFEIFNEVGLWNEKKGINLGRWYKIQNIGLNNIIKW